MSLSSADVSPSDFGGVRVPEGFVDTIPAAFCVLMVSSSVAMALSMVESTARAPFSEPMLSQVGQGNLDTTLLWMFEVIVIIKLVCRMVVMRVLLTLNEVDCSC